MVSLVAKVQAWSAQVVCRKMTGARGAGARMRRDSRTERAWRRRRDADEGVDGGVV